MSDHFSSKPCFDCLPESTDVLDSLLAGPMASSLSPPSASRLPELELELKATLFRSSRLDSDDILDDFLGRWRRSRLDKVVISGVSLKDKMSHFQYRISC